MRRGCQAVVQGIYRSKAQRGSGEKQQEIVKSDMALSVGIGVVFLEVAGRSSMVVVVVEVAWLLSQYMLYLLL